MRPTATIETVVPTRLTTSWTPAGSVRLRLAAAVSNATQPVSPTLGSRLLPLPFTPPDVWLARGVVAVVAQAVHGAMDRRVDDPAQVAVLVDEVNAVRRRRWSAFEGPLGACAVRLTFQGRSGRVGVLVLQGDELLELGVNRRSGYKRELGTFDAPALRRLAARIRKPSDCKP